MHAGLADLQRYESHGKEIGQIQNYVHLRRRTGIMHHLWVLNASCARYLTRLATPARQAIDYEEEAEGRKGGHHARPQ